MDKANELRISDSLALPLDIVTDTIGILAIKAEIEVSKTPEQKLKERRARMELMMMLGIAGAYGLPTLKRGGA